MSGDSARVASRRSFVIRSAVTVAASSGAARFAFGAQRQRVHVSRAGTPAGSAGTLWLGGELQLNRIGLGTAEFTGPGRWGMPSDPRAIRALLRRALELGVNFIDTADVYGPGAAEQLIYDALSPYPRDLVIATKGGQTHNVREKANEFDARPAQLRAACEASLRRLHLEQLPLYYLHSPDPKVPFEDSVGELGRLQREGKIRHIGVANVDLPLLARARAVVTVASVQNPYNILRRADEDVLELCERERIVFTPYGPLGMRGGRPLPIEDVRLAGLQAVAQSRHLELAPIVLAWQLARSAVMLPIPGTTRIDHLEEDVGAARVHLSAAEMRQIG